MNKEQIIKQIHADLNAAIDPIYGPSTRRHFKEEIKLHGVRTPQVRAIAAKHSATLKKESIQEVWQLSEQFMSTGYREDAIIASVLVYKRKKEWSVDDFTTLERWLNLHVTNWAICDDLCNHLIGYCIEKFPEVVPTVRSWTTSDNRWLRRASAVSFILPARKGHTLEDVLYVADQLLHDEDDLVQKGVGWMLKEASKCHQLEIVACLEKHKTVMPRTMFRYALEKLPVEVKKRLMA